MTNPTELLPRPFCGGDELSHGYDNAGIYQSVVRCHADDCGAAIVLVGQSEGDAIAAWLVAEADGTSPLHRVEAGAVGGGGLPANSPLSAESPAAVADTGKPAA